MGLIAFCLLILSAPMQAHYLFYAGVALIGFGNGLFGVATLTSAMTLPAHGHAGRGLALGAWGAAQATAAGLSIFLGGAIRDLVNKLAQAGDLGPAMSSAATGYSVVYHFELGLLFLTLIALGPLVRRRALHQGQHNTKVGLADFPT
jgi:PUCC protein.